LYKSIVGMDKDEYDEREKFKYCFLIIWNDPCTMIYQGLDKRVK